MNIPTPTADTLVVLGCAPGAPEKMNELVARLDRFDVAAVNAAGLFWTKSLKLWCSYHFEMMNTLVYWRRRAYLPMEGICYILDVPAPGLDAVIMSSPFHGSSSMLAVHAGLTIGYPQIILVGVEIPEEAYGHFRPGWEDFAKTPEARRVTSISGWTAELLGKPKL